MARKSCSRVCGSFEDFFAKQKPNSETVTKFLEHYLSREEVSVLVDGMKECMSMQKESCFYASSCHYMAHLLITFAPIKHR